jgi:antitoxin YefM
MKQLDLDEDIRPVTEFRAKAAEFIDQVRETGRPLILTERGRSAAVVLSISEYERLTYELGLVNAVLTGLEQAERGEVIPHKEAIKQIRARIRR